MVPYFFAIVGGESKVEISLSSADDGIFTLAINLDGTRGGAKREAESFAKSRRTVNATFGGDGGRRRMIARTENRSEFKTGKVVDR